MPDLEDRQVDAADEKEIERTRRRLREQDKQGDQFWKAVFADPVGRAEMWKLLAACHTFEQKFGVGPNGFPQPEASWYWAGERDFGLRLYRTWLVRDLTGVMSMHVECDPDFPKQPK